MLKVLISEASAVLCSMLSPHRSPAKAEAAVPSAKRQLFPTPSSPAKPCAQQQAASAHRLDAGHKSLAAPCKAQQAYAAEQLQHTAQRQALHSQGHLHLIMGPMFAGKTTALLEQVRKAEQAGHRVAVITSKLDMRYGKRQCVSHAGHRRAALPVSNLSCLRSPDANAEGFDLGQFDTIAIDESQFFGDLPEFVQYAVEERKKCVIVAGLSGDYKRQFFGHIVSLVPLADNAEFLKARCNFCEQPASFTLRLVANAEQQLIGGKDAYQPVCRHHYASLARVAEDFVP